MDLCPWLQAPELLGAASLVVTAICIMTRIIMTKLLIRAYSLVAGTRLRVVCRRDWNSFAVLLGPKKI